MAMNTLPLEGMPEPRQEWTVREIARTSGRSLGHVAGMARSLVPGYVSPEPGRTAGIPAAIAMDLVLVLRHAVFSPRFVELVRSDPEAAREGVEALNRLVAASAESAGEEATPAA